jgi:secreted PhoX family phosphatase
LLVLKTSEAHFHFGLLEMRTLHAARFNDDGPSGWLPLSFGQGLPTTANGLALQADILLNTRRAADPPAP